MTLEQGVKVERVQCTDDPPPTNAMLALVEVQPLSVHHRCLPLNIYPTFLVDMEEVVH